MFQYNTQGVCSKAIYFEAEDNKLKNVSYVAGCNGNLKGISSLVEGMDIDDVIARLEGTPPAAARRLPALISWRRP